MSSSLEAKIVVLGAQGVGKTSLVDRYVKNDFSPSTTSSTVGASFVTKRVLDSASDTIVRLQIWDTAGQERFRSISRLYYRGANACLLCYDITSEQSFQEMTGWLAELKRNLVDGDDDPIVIHVVGTKTDIVTLDPGRRRVPFERTIAYVADQLYPTRASTPPVTAGLVVPGSGFGGGGGGAFGVGGQTSASTLTGGAGGGGCGGGTDSKRSSAFWGQDIGWDCCHEISAKDGEGIEEVFRVITRKLVEQQRNRRDAAAAAAGSSSQRSSTVFDGGLVVGTPGGGEGGAGGAGGSFRLGYGDKRRSWLGFPPSSSVGDEIEDALVEGRGKRRGGCC
ncbi:P-loop containing nucleoside triphosphate hydrolase protein [Aspergillus heteromorphus CBS 117.55]|uniref:P-loop containing nucleoside triphosphate hydrolase protein n=1 Tax=Aspergillus heteromorphus CBS 117.55 TaxID=1448321 RepID=A0A317VQ79_9EURO|nr:P-loop containing nucleoside triphosphate hydrolase protein [Aspergillus heteromorphus CBS 117.55]PWY75431.1 P-loop containing nucleoside triphosphate hydrolase protein [Aspergillus heteromorphus CBS 117.55]